MKRVSFLFAWFDLWVGFYFDRRARKLYFLPVPMFGIVIDVNKGAPILRMKRSIKHTMIIWALRFDKWYGYPPDWGYALTFGFVVMLGYIIVEFWKRVIL